MKKTNEIIEYSPDVQKLLIQFMLSTPDAYVRCQNIIKDTYWDAPLRPAIRYIQKFASEYRALPTFEQVNAESKVKFEKLSDIRDNHVEWFFDTIEQFCRHRAMEQLILDGPTLLEKGNYAELEKRSKENMLISLQKDLGTDYFSNPMERLERMKRKTDTTSTGWKDVDEKLYGGFNRGEMSIFAGGPGTGKSLFLQNLALNWVMMGLNVVYITLELSEELVGLRLDSMMVKTPSREIFRNIESVAMRLASMKKQNIERWGRLQIKKMPEAGTTVNDIRAFLKEYEIQTGVKPDAILVDYLDLLTPYSVKIQASDQFIKDKYTSEELRGLAIEWNILCATASQLNRASVQEENYDMSHIAGGISKINTADNLIAIHTNALMKERGEYQLQFLKTRSSSGVGQKVMLSLDTTCLRISDFEGDASAAMTVSELDRITNELRERKAKLTVNNDYTPGASKNTQTTQATQTSSNTNSLTVPTVSAPLNANTSSSGGTSRLRNLIKHTGNLD